jgi:hypothetical protein
VISTGSVEQLDYTIGDYNQARKMDVPVMRFYLLGYILIDAIVYDFFLIFLLIRQPLIAKLAMQLSAGLFPGLSLAPQVPWLESVLPGPSVLHRQQQGTP